MRIEVDFYAKHQVAVNFTTENIYGDHDHELLMYAWFTLRQLHNQGHHLAADGFSGLISSEGHDVISMLLENNPKLPAAIDLLSWAQGARFPYGDTSGEKNIAQQQILGRC